MQTSGKKLEKKLSSTSRFVTETLCCSLIEARAGILLFVVNNTALVFSLSTVYGVTSAGLFVRVKSSSKKQEEKKTSYAREHKCACLALDKEESVVGYVVPVCRSRWLAFLLFLPIPNTEYGLGMYQIS